ncbi:ketoacyl-ACP synthase III [Thermostilla marina]
MTQPTTRQRESSLPLKPSRTGTLTGVQILGVGGAVPDNVVANEDLAGLGCDTEWIIQRTGMRERRHAPPDQSTGDLAVEAARRCIAQAGADPGDIDLVLLGTYTPDMTMPATAGYVQDRLGLQALAFDMQAACASFVFAMLSGMQYVATGCSKLALVIGADCASRVANPKDVKTYPLFGDGAGAVLLGRGDDAQGLLGFAVGSDGSGAPLLCRPMGGAKMPYSNKPEDYDKQFVYMEGRPIFKWAVRMLHQTVHEVLDTAGLPLEAIDLVILHQANQRIIDAAMKNLGIPPEKVFSNLDRYGNTSSASIPLALAEAYEAGLIKPGTRVLMSGFGGGLAWGTMLFQW